MKYLPFQIFTSKHLGIQYSSITQWPGFLPAHGIGQANIQCFANAATGNLAVQSRHVDLDDLAGPLDFFYTVNTQANIAASAHFNHDLKIQVPSSPGKPASIQVTGGDGVVVKYQWDVSHKRYVAPGHANGIPTISYNEDYKAWVRYDPATKMQWIFNSLGQLVTRINAQGHALQYLYTDGLLTSIITESGDEYVLSYRTDKSNNSIITISLKGVANPIVQYTLDAKKRLKQAAYYYNTNKPYHVNYEYWDTSSAKLKSITQDDGSKANFTFDSANRIEHVQTGDQAPYDLTYQAGNTHLTTAAGAIAILEYDDDKRINKFIGYQTDINADTATQSYTYHGNGQPDTCILANGSKVQRTFDVTSGLLVNSTHPQGQQTKYIYDDHDNVTIKQDYVDTLGTISINCTRYVYITIKTEPNKIPISFCAYKISPMGRVTEYVPTNEGLIAEVRQYTNVMFNVSKLLPDDPISDDQMVKWKGKLSAEQQQTTLHTNVYNGRGQIEQTQQFDAVDSSNKGVLTPSTGWQQSSWDRYGGELTHKVSRVDSQLKDPTFAQQSQEFTDSLHRQTSHTDYCHNTTTHSFDKDKYTTSLPELINPVLSKQALRRSVTTTQDNAGLAAAESDISEIPNLFGDATSQTKTTSQVNDLASRVRVVTHNDGGKTITFLDPQHRPEFEISRTGIVTQYFHSLTLGVETITHYANSIEVSSLYDSGKTLPDIKKLIAQLPTLQKNPDNRCTYKIKDKLGRIQFEIDGDRYLTEHLYDSANHKIGVIRYAIPLSSAQVTDFTDGHGIPPKYDNTKDRAHRWFYDDDGLLSAEQDGGGYVIEYTRNPAKLIIAKRRYATPIPVDFAKTTFASLHVEETNDDAQTRFFHSLKGDLVAKVELADAQKQIYYYTAYTHYPDGTVKSSCRYATPLKAFPDKPTPPAESDNDEVKAFAYDETARNISDSTLYGVTKTNEFDSHGNHHSNQSRDSLNLKAIDGDCARGTQAIFDPRGNPYATANAMVNAVLIAQKDPEKLKTYWQSCSVQHRVDANDLICETTLSADGDQRYRYIIFYDGELRPCVVIDPTGAIVEKTYNNFSEEYTTRYYDKRLISDELKTLTGGLITKAVTTLIHSKRNDVEDVLTTKYYDHRGHVKVQIDGDKFKTTQHTNAFGEVDEQDIPVASKEPTLNITREFDTRGNVTELEKSAKDLVSRESYEYKNLFGRQTKSVGADGHALEFGHDNLGRKVTTKDLALNAITHTQSYNAFDQVKTSSDALKQVTTFKHVRKTRTTTKVSPSGIETQTVTNAFKQRISRQIATRKPQKWTHKANGKQESHITSLGYTTQDQYDYRNQHRRHQRPDNSARTWDMNGAKQLTAVSELDASGNIYAKDTFVPDAFGNPVEHKDRLGTTHLAWFDKRHNCIKRIDDPNRPDDKYIGANIITEHSYNGLSQQESTIKGDTVTAVEYNSAKSIDGLGRDVGDVLAPPLSKDDEGALNFANHKKLSPGGKIRSFTDRNGNITYIIYDAAGRKRFRVRPVQTIDGITIGGVREWQYNNNNYISQIRDYETAYDMADISLKTTYDELVTWAQKNTNSNDTIIYQFYNDENQLKFKVDATGQVVEYEYDNYGNQTLEIKYKKAYDISLIDNTTTEKLISWSSKNSDPKDRKTYRFYDDDNRIRFLIDADHVAHETEYLDYKHIKTTITFGHRVTKPDSLVGLTPDEIHAKLVSNDGTDRYRYYGIDEHENPLFEVDENGSITGFVHNLKQSLTNTTRYSTKLEVPAAYADIEAAVKKIMAAPLKSDDRQIIFHRNAVDFCDKKIDPIGNADGYDRNVVGKVLTHVDRDEQMHEQFFDRGMRHTLSITPPFPVSYGHYDTKTEKPVVTDPVLHRRQDLRELDRSGNVTGLIMAQHDPDERQSKAQVNALNKMVGTSTKVPVDDPDVNASFSKPPVNIKTVGTKTIYNAKGLKIVHIGKNGETLFWVYDQHKRLKYFVNSDNRVTKFVRNEFGEVGEFVRYNNRLEVDLTPYLNKGLNADFIEQHLTKCPADRTIKHWYNGVGKEIEREFDPVYVYDTKTKKLYTFTKRLLFERSVSQKLTARRILSNTIDPKNPVWVLMRYWYDLKDNLIAFSDKNGCVTTHNINAFSESEKAYEYANKLTGLKVDTTYAQLLNMLKEIVDPTNDREYVLTRDNRGLVTSDTLKNAQFAMWVDAEGKPYTPSSNGPARLKRITGFDLTRTHKFTATERHFSTKMPDGNKSRTYSNGEGHVIATTDFARNRFDRKGLPTTNIPLTFYNVNSFGEWLGRKRFAQGAKSLIDFKPNERPEPKAPSSDDLLELRSMDTRGKPSFKQSASGHVKGSTFTASGDKAREFNHMTDYMVTNSKKTKDHNHANQTNRSDFRRYRTPADGNCGYTAFGMTREVAYNLLTQHLHAIRELLQPVIQEALLTQRFFDYLKAHQAIADRVTLDHITNNLDRYSNDLVIAQLYVSYDVRDKNIDAGWAHPAVLHALAKILGIELHIWEAGDNDEYIPYQHSQYAHFTPGVVNGRRDLLFVNGNHFDILDLEQNENVSTTSSANTHGPNSMPGSRKPGDQTNNEINDDTNDKTVVKGTCHIDERRTTYNSNRKPVSHARIRDGLVESERLSNYNAFDEVKARGIVKQTKTGMEKDWYITIEHNNLGQTFRSNESGRTELTLRNGLGALTNRVTSVNKDLSTIPESSFQANVLDANYRDVQQQRFVRDNMSHVTEAIEPTRLASLFAEMVIPLEWQVKTDYPTKGKTSVVWANPTGVDLSKYTMQAFLRVHLEPMGSSVHLEPKCYRQFTIQHSDDTYYIDLTELACDRYDIAMIYYDKTATENDKPLAMSQGQIQITTTHGLGQSQWLTIRMQTDPSISNSIVFYLDGDFSKYAYANTILLCYRSDGIEPILGLTKVSDTCYKAIWYEGQVFTANKIAFNLKLGCGSYYGSNGIYGLQVPMNIHGLNLSFSAEASNEPIPIKVITPAITYEHTRWSQVKAKTNAQGKTWQYEIDNQNHLLQETTPSVTNMGEKGNTTTESLIKSFATNLYGYHLGMSDPRNHIQADLIDEGGHHIMHVTGEGVHAEFDVRNALDLLIDLIDSRGQRWHFVYTGGLLTQVQFPSSFNSDAEVGRIRIIGYNELDMINRSGIHSDVYKLSDYYNFNAQGNVCAHIDQMCNIMFRLTDHNNQSLANIWSITKMLLWTRNPFGHELTHRDFKGVNYTSSYNFDATLSQKVSDQGHQKYENIWPFLNYPSSVYPILFAFTNNTVAPPQHLQFLYNGGVLSGIIDVTQQTQQIFLHDACRRRIQMSVYKLLNNFLMYQTSALYDALNRLITNRTLSVTMNMFYDRSGNTVQIDMFSNDDPSNRISVCSTFDADNRVLIDSGYRDSEGVVKIGYQKGIKYGYRVIGPSSMPGAPDGFRHSETHYPSSSGPQTNIPTYDDDGLLGDTKIAGQSTPVIRKRDTVGNITLYDDVTTMKWPFHPFYRKIGLHAEYQYFAAYVLKSCVTESYALTHKPIKSITTIDQKDIDHYGNTLHKTVVTQEKPNYDHWVFYYIAYVDLHYVGADTFILSKLSGSGKNNQNRWAPINVQVRKFDSNMALHQLNSDVFYLGAPDGQILFGIKCMSPNISPYVANASNVVVYISSPSGAILGSVQGNDIKLAAGASLNSATHYFRTKNLASGGQLTLPSARPGLNSVRHGHAILTGQEHLRIFDPIHPVTFVEGNAMLPSGGAIAPNKAKYYLNKHYIPQIRTHRLQPGETIEKVAKMFDGSSAAAKMLRIFNGLVDGNTLPATETIMIPDFIQVHHDAETSYRYQKFISILSEHLEIKIDFPVPHHSFLSSLIEAIVSVAIIIVAPQVAGIITKAAGFFLDALVGGLMDASAQGVMIGLGIQDSFSVSQLIGTAVGAGTAGLFGGAAGKAAGATAHAAAAAAKPSIAALIKTEMAKEGISIATSELQALASGHSLQFNFGNVVSGLEQVLMNTALDEFNIHEFGSLANIPNSARIIEGVVGDLENDAVTDIAMDRAMTLNELANLMGTTIGDEIGGAADHELKHLHDQHESDNKARQQITRELQRNENEELMRSAYRRAYYASQGKDTRHLEHAKNPHPYDHTGQGHTDVETDYSEQQQLQHLEMEWYHELMARHVGELSGHVSAHGEPYDKAGNAAIRSESHVPVTRDTFMDQAEYKGKVALYDITYGAVVVTGYAAKAANWFTYKLMKDVGGQAGVQYYDDLHNPTPFKTKLEDGIKFFYATVKNVALNEVAGYGIARGLGFAAPLTTNAMRTFFNSGSLINGDMSGQLLEEGGTASIIDSIKNSPEIRIGLEHARSFLRDNMLDVPEHLVNVYGAFSKYGLSSGITMTLGSMYSSRLIDRGVDLMFEDSNRFLPGAVKFGAKGLATFGLFAVNNKVETGRFDFLDDFESSLIQRGGDLAFFEPLRPKMPPALYYYLLMHKFGFEFATDEVDSHQQNRAKYRTYGN